MTLPTQQKIWILAHKVVSDVPPDTFRLETRPLPAVDQGHVLVRLNFLSNDPAQRTRIQEGATVRGGLLPVPAQTNIRRGVHFLWSMPASR